MVLSSSIFQFSSYDSAPLMKTLTNISKPAYKTKVQPTTVIPKAIGNMYTASLYASLVSLLAVEGDRLVCLSSQHS